MSIIKIPYFQEINLEKPEPDYYSDTLYEGNQVYLTIVCSSPEQHVLTEKSIEEVRFLLDNFVKIDKKLRKTLKKDYSEKGTVHEYLQHHLDVVEPETMSKYIDLAHPKISAIDQLFEKIQLKSWYIYPFYENGIEVSVDYILIGGQFTTYVLCFKLDKKGKILSLSMES